jgi:uncharacterized repeat protein (TIGR02059 family)
MAYAIYISQRGLVNIHDCTFIHFNRGAVQFSGHEGGAEPTTYAVGNQVYNNIATDCGNFFLTQNYLTSAFQEIGQDQMLIHDNTITQTGRTYGTNGVGIAAHYLKGMKIYNNTITTDPNMGNDYSTYGSAVSTFVIELWNVTGGVEIYNNNFYNGTLDIAGDYNTKGAYAYSVSTHNNKFSRAMGNIVKDAIELEMAPPFDNILIYDNWIENYSRGMTIYNEGVGTFSNISIYYNVFNNIGTTNANNSYYDAWGIEMNGYFASTINNLNIWNNTIIGHVGGSAVGGIGFVGEGTYTNVSIKNNIIMNFTGQAPVYNQGGGGLAMSSYIVNNNDFYNNGNSNLVRDNGITPTNYNFTSGNITTIPGFVSAGTDFHLQVGSPAIGKGLKTTGITTDYDGNTIKDPPSIGAYEYNSLPPSPVIPAYQSSAIENTTPSLLEMTYNTTLANVIPAASAFSVLVNSIARTVSSVVISGPKVLLTLSSPVVNGNVVTVAYTKPSTNPLQSVSGGIAASIVNQAVINNCISIPVTNGTTPVNQPPVITISNPSKGNKFENPATITIDAVASDPDGTISKVEFYSGSDKLVELTSPPYSYTWKDVKAGTYSITAIATDNLDATTTSLPIEFDVGTTIKYDADSKIINLYPNPNDGHFSIEFINPLQNEKSEIIITDLAGKQVYNGLVSKEETLKQIDLSYIKSGIYILMLIYKEILITKKIIKY